MTQKNDYKILPLLRRHIDQMAEIELICFSQPWSKQTLRDELSERCARYFVCEHLDGTVIGYIGTRMVEGECYITNIAIRPEYRRQGYAKILYNALSEYVERENLEKITLEVRESNAAARAFYEQCGFSYIGVRKGYYSLPDEDALLMLKITENNHVDTCI